MDEEVKGSTEAPVEQATENVQESVEQPAEEVVPKWRFDQVIAERNAERENLALYQQALQQYQQNPSGSQPTYGDDDADPLVHEVQSLKSTVQQQQAQMAQWLDRQEKETFWNSVGRGASADLQAEVESLVQQYRVQGQNLSRSDAFYYVKGKVEHAKQQSQLARAPQAQQAVARVNQVAETNSTTPTATPQAEESFEDVVENGSPEDILEFAKKNGIVIG